MDEVFDLKTRFDVALQHADTVSWMLVVTPNKRAANSAVAAAAIMDCPLTGQTGHREMFTKLKHGHVIKRTCLSVGTLKNGTGIDLSLYELWIDKGREMLISLCSLICSIK